MEISGCAVRERALSRAAPACALISLNLRPLSLLLPSPLAGEGLGVRGRRAGRGRRICICAAYTFGPAARTSADASASYFRKFSQKRFASFFAVASYAFLSAQVWRGVRTSGGTP